MTFEKITWDGLHKISTDVEFDSLESVKQMLNERFTTEDNVVRYEEMKMQNGKESVSIKDQGNKIIVQYKTK